jgi:hypothetical protein
MKIIKYKFLVGEVDAEPILSDVEMGWNETNEEVAKREAYNGEYEIYDDGKEEITEPTETEALDARLTYVEMMTGLLEV